MLPAKIVWHSCSPFTTVLYKFWYIIFNTGIEVEKKYNRYV